MAARVLRWLAAVLVCGCRLGFDLSAVDTDADIIDAVIEPPTDHNIVFVTSTTVVAGELGGLPAADSTCMTLAMNAGLPGTYVAWLSSSTASARDRLGTARGWVGRDGRPFADTIADMTAGKIFYPIRLDESGAVVAGDVITATGADGLAASSGTCADFTSTIGIAAVGVTGTGTGTWTHSASGDCAIPGRLYCFGVDRTLPVSIVPDTRRRAFVTTAWFTSGSGLAQADQLCQNEAAQAGLPGTFRALLATTSASAISRFSLQSGWTRVDGVEVSADGQGFDAALIAPLNVTADLSYVHGNTFAWTGASDPNVAGTDGSTCSNWVRTNSTGTGGRIGYVTPRYFDWGSPPPNCGDASAARLFCVQE